MNDTTIVTGTADDAARWRAWQVTNERLNRRSAHTSRILAVILLGGTIAWVVVQLLSSPALGS